MELWELVAREGIRDLVARYNAQGDSGRFGEVIALFAPDAVLEVTMGGSVRTYDGKEAITGFFTGAEQSSPGAAAKSPERSYLRHFTATHQIDLVDEQRATGRCYFALLLSGGLAQWGRYLDEYVQHEGRWLFSRRRAVVDQRTPDAGA